VKRTCIVLALILALVHLSFADVTFPRVKLVDTQGHQAKASLTFDDSNKVVEVHLAKGNSLLVPYDQADKFSYEITRKHRITTGAIVLLAVSVIGGIIVMSTKSTNHWLDIDYHNSGEAKNVVLHLDKRDYQKVIDAVKNHTGKDVEFLGCRLCKMKN
jgi:hypothetical protein